MDQPPITRHAHNSLSTTLGELELRVMEYVWNHPGDGARCIAANLATTKRPSLSTVQSTLERLVKKGCLERKKKSHAYCYYPRQSRSELMGAMLKDVIGLLHDGRAATILSSFVNVAVKLDENALDELEALIRKKRGES